MKTKGFSNVRGSLLAGLSFLVAATGASAQGVCNSMTFTDVTAAAGITHTYARPLADAAVMTGGAVAVDVNGDGLLDLYVAQGVGPNLLYINDGAGGFVNEAATRNAELASVYSVAVSAADFDNDGDMDIAVSVTAGQSIVLINDGTGNFTQQIALPLPNGRTQSSSWGDIDNDGILELAISEWVPNGDTGPQGLYMYRYVNGTFQNYDFRTVPATDVHVFAPRFADLNGDRLADLHVASDFGASRKYINLGNGMFSGSAGHGGNNDMGHTIGDYDNDGDLDIFVTDINTNGGNQLNRNNGQGSFTPVSQAAGIVDGHWGWAASFGDLDNDGDLDIYHVNGWQGREEQMSTPSRLFMNNNNGTFSEVAACAGAGIAEGSQGRGMHLFDYDNDGDLDIFVVNNAYVLPGVADGPGRPVLLRNDTNNGNRWLKVELDGVPPLHRNGIGSRVYVQAGGVTQMHEMHASTNFLSQNAGHIAHFGFGSTNTVSEVKGEWVSGDATVLANVATNQSISIPSPKATVSSRSVAIGQNVTATSNETNPVEWEVNGSTFADPLTTSFTTSGTKELKLLVYNPSMTSVVRSELIRVEVTGAVGEPEITSPVPGSTLLSSTVSFQWSDNGADVDEWQLLVGTSVGGSDLHSSGALPATTTSAVVSGLPTDGSQLHVTLLWSASGGSAGQKNYTYTAASGTGLPTMVAPAPGGTLAGASETFQWSAEGADVETWRLLVGTSPGGTDIFVSNFSSAITSVTVNGLPTDGSTVYVMLRWRINGVVSDTMYTYTASGDGGGGGGGGSGIPTMVSPAPGDTLAGASETFQWSAEGADVETWRLLIGTTSGGSDLYSQNFSSGTTSVTVSGLPTDGSTVYVRLRWRINGVVSDTIYSYTASGDGGGGGGGGGVPAMLSPAPGSLLAGSSQTFQWSADGADVETWRLLVGTSPGAKNLFAQNFASGTTSVTVNGLPTDGSIVYVMLRWRINGVITDTMYTYTAALQ